MTKTVTVIDYGVGNTLSLSRAIESCGAKVKLSDSCDDVKNAQVLILPGVGSFHYGMRELESRNLVVAIKEFIASGRFFLGVCLGMQMMLDSSCEHQICSGLGIINGDVIPLPSQGPDDCVYKIPHISWNRLYQPADQNNGLWDNTILKGISPGAYVYFVHSFFSDPVNSDDILARTSFYEKEFSSVIRKDNAFGVQFHPEKSGEVGLKILNNFLSLSC